MSSLLTTRLVPLQHVLVTFISLVMGVDVSFADTVVMHYFYRRRESSIVDTASIDTAVSTAPGRMSPREAAAQLEASAEASPALVNAVREFACMYPNRFVRAVTKHLGEQRTQHDALLLLHQLLTLPGFEEQLPRLGDVHAPQSLFSALHAVLLRNRPRSHTAGATAAAPSSAANAAVARGGTSASHALPEATTGDAAAAVASVLSAAATPTDVTVATAAVPVTAVPSAASSPLGATDEDRCAMLACWNMVILLPYSVKHVGPRTGELVSTVVAMLCARWEAAPLDAAPSGRDKRFGAMASGWDGGGGSSGSITAVSSGSDVDGGSVAAAAAAAAGNSGGRGGGGGGGGGGGQHAVPMALRASLALENSTMPHPFDSPDGDRSTLAYTQSPGGRGGRGQAT
jgi:hypothetical protein